jgi:hypothetical protein
MSLQEGIHDGEFLLSEAPAWYSRDEGTVTTASTALVSGTVLGQVTDGTTATSTAKTGNTGTGAMGTVTVGAAARVGRYTLTITDAASNAGQFAVEDPDGMIIGEGNVGAAFNQGGLSFTLADATDFVVGDQIYIDVAVGTGKYKPYSSAATDGSQNANAVLFTSLPGESADHKAFIITRNAEVKEALLTGLDAAAKASLKKVGIITRA